MTNYEDLVIESNTHGIKVIELDFGTPKPCGRCIGKNILINKYITEDEKYCVLCEELGHYHLTIGNITNQTDITNRKQERLAREWGYRRSAGLLKIIEAFENGCSNRYEIAVYLNITEKYLDTAISYFTSKYGLGCQVDNYYIQFIPNLGLMKGFD